MILATTPSRASRIIAGDALNQRTSKPVPACPTMLTDVDRTSSLLLAWMRPGRSTISGTTLLAAVVANTVDTPTKTPTTSRCAKDRSPIIAATGMDATATARKRVAMARVRPLSHRSIQTPRRVRAPAMPTVEQRGIRLPEASRLQSRRSPAGEGRSRRQSRIHTGTQGLSTVRETCALSSAMRS